MSTDSNRFWSLLVSKAGVLVGRRKSVNLIEGSGVTLTTTDDATNNRVNVTIASSGGADFSGLTNGAIVKNNAGVPADAVAGTDYVTTAQLALKMCLLPFATTTLSSASDTYAEAYNVISSSEFQIGIITGYPIRAGTFQNMRIRTLSNSLNVASSITLYKDGVATALTVAPTAHSSTIYNDLTHTVSFTAGQLFAIVVFIPGNGDGGAIGLQGTIEFIPS